MTLTLLRWGLDLKVQLGVAFSLVLFFDVDLLAKEGTYFLINQREQFLYSISIHTRKALIFFPTCHSSLLFLNQINLSKFVKLPNLILNCIPHCSRSKCRKSVGRM